MTVKPKSPADFTLQTWTNQKCPARPLISMQQVIFLLKPFTGTIWPKRMVRMSIMVDFTTFLDRFGQGKSVLYTFWVICSRGRRITFRRPQASKCQGYHFTDNYQARQGTLGEQLLNMTVLRRLIQRLERLLYPPVFTLLNKREVGNTILNTKRKTVLPFVQYATNIQVSLNCYSFMTGISCYNSQLTSVYLLHIKKGGQKV